MASKPWPTRQNPNPKTLDSTRWLNWKDTTVPVVQYRYRIGHLLACVIASNQYLMIGLLLLISVRNRTFFLNALSNTLTRSTKPERALKSTLSTPRFREKAHTSTRIGKYLVRPHILTKVRRDEAQHLIKSVHVNSNTAEVIL